MIESNLSNQENLVSPTLLESPVFENSLRPKTLNEYVGQSTLKNNLKIAIKSSKIRNDTLDHILLHGPAGTGKTTLANIVAIEVGTSLKITSGPALEKVSDIASIISNLKENDILFIDEIHRLKSSVEEVLYTAMEDFAIDIVIGKGPSARAMRINLPKFTLIGATTKISMLSSPLRDRFGNVFHFQNYSDLEIEEILVRSSGILDVKLDKDALRLLSSSSRKTPRIANRLLKRVRDFAVFHELEKIDFDNLKLALNDLGIDNMGLDERDREILSVIIEKFSGGPVGLSTISAAVKDEEDTIESVYEPFLIQLGFLERTPRGRIVTKSAYKHLNIKNVQYE
ncbi:MAG: Holliday junction branch migration DNA helicase RuvB [Candidatus Gracilibacteria bacterium]|jgi:Holliday junction DNA helicase RuvB|nr:Holliday junction branch migration DNA helicase RuvB [Candidatus Gracilibacteria bacterium]